MYGNTLIFFSLLNKAFIASSELGNAYTLSLTSNWSLFKLNFPD